jgi:hypothetical protein
MADLMCAVMNWNNSITRADDEETSSWTKKRDPLSAEKRTSIGCSGTSAKCQ